MYWTHKVEGGPRRVNHAAVAVGEYVFSFGGYCTGENFRDEDLFMPVYVLNTTTLRWRKILPPEGDDEAAHEADLNWPSERYGHSAVEYQGKVFIFGGRNDNQASNAVHVFDTSTMSFTDGLTTGSPPGARDGHAACRVGKEMYIYGGYEDEMGLFPNDIYALDLERMHWQQVVIKGPVPPARDFHTLTAIGHRIFLWGGRSQDPTFFFPNPHSEVYYSNAYVFVRSIHYFT